LAFADQVLFLVRQAVLVRQGVEIGEETRAVRGFDQVVQETVDAQVGLAARMGERIGPGDVARAFQLAADVPAVGVDRGRVGRLAQVLEDQRGDVGDRGGVGLPVRPAGPVRTARRA